MFNFPYMFDQLAKPLTIIIHSEATGYDDAGFPLPSKPATEVHVTEPLVVNTNPNVTFDTGPGGVYSTNQLVWQSKRFTDAPRGTVVIDNSDNSKYRVTGKARTNLSNSTLYQVKAVKNQ